MKRDERFERWLDAVIERHTAGLRRPEFLKAIRALSVRYVEERATLHARSAIDSVGKRAAFAAFYAPLHYLTIQGIVRAQRLDRLRPRRIVDLGCGTGVAGAALATTMASSNVRLLGVDSNQWAVTEATWTWRQFDLPGRVRRADLVRTAESLLREDLVREATIVILGWAVNELDADKRRRLLPILLNLVRKHAVVVVVEPISQRLLPWWDDWSAAFESVGGSARAWQLPIALPVSLAEADADAGFSRDRLTARSLFGGGGLAGPR